MAEDALDTRDPAERLRMLVSALEHATDGIMVYVPSAMSKIAYMNDGFRQLTGYGSDEIGADLVQLLAGPAEGAGIEHLELALSTGRRFAGELLSCRKDGTEYYADIRLEPVRDNAGELQYWVVLSRDVTERRRMELLLEHRVLHDALTGLPNRLLLHDRLANAIAHGRREKRPVALLLMDVDHLKQINDTFGHQTGDLLLMEIGSRLNSLFRESDTVARLGDDEFGLVLPDLGDLPSAVLAAQEIVSALEEPLVLADRTVPIGISVGVAMFPEHGGDAETLMRHADAAMYTAKREGTGYAVYVAREHDQAAVRLALAAGLRGAIQHEELVLHYQPIVSVQSGQLLHVEALVRWQAPGHGLLPPARFIPIAEQTGLIRPLSTWVMNKALRQCRAWIERGLHISVAVNLSMLNLRDRRLPLIVEECLREAGVAPRYLHIEMTESTLMADAAQTMETVNRLNDIGVSLSIDDFGTGYSSLAYLKQLPVDEIKIDKSFVGDMATNESSAVIVRSIIDLAHNLELHVVAEGVENRGTWDWLSLLGCDAAQGYYISHPSPGGELERWLAGRQQVQA